jgi:hypothetical protein
MSTDQLLKEIIALPEEDLQLFLNRLLTDRKIIEQVEHFGYLRLTEKSLEFWNDPREDLYQDYTRTRRARS